MNGKHLFLTSAGLTDKMKEKFFDIIGKCPKDVKVLKLADGKAVYVEDNYMSVI